MVRKVCVASVECVISRCELVGLWIRGRKEVESLREEFGFELQRDLSDIRSEVSSHS